MKCKICGEDKLNVVYHGVIRNGQPGNLTSKEYDVYQCEKCKTIWHDTFEAFNEFYESEEYYCRLESNSDIQTYYNNYDRNTLRKFEWMDTVLFRGAIVADVGAGGGSFIDAVSGTAKETIAIEPSKIFRNELEKKGHTVFAYTNEATKAYAESVDIVTSFDVIEHVEDPLCFCKDIYGLLAPGGKVVLGTPTDYPHLRKLLGAEFDQFLFSVQHPWVLLENGLRILFEKSGFSSIDIRYKQMYGLGNTISWAYNRKACGHTQYPFITDTVDAVYKAQMCENKQSDYLVVYATK